MRKTSCSMKCVYRQLGDVCMSEVDRRRAAYALCHAEAIVDGVIWVKDQLASLGAMVLKPGYRQG
ncbi:MAG TPA: hypothetical protein VKD25_03605 [Burkholderiales bacterium]|nr:hypothetical protein [Burkholderiales bacterium]